MTWRLKTPRGRSAASISVPLVSDPWPRSARTVSTLRSTSRSIDSVLTPGRSNSMWKTSPLRQASIGMNAGRVAVPNTCWVRRSRSRNGSVRINIEGSPPQVAGCLGRPLIYSGRYRFYPAVGRDATSPEQESSGKMSDSRLSVYVISVAAEMVGTGVQNLRAYERAGLVTPGRTAGGTRLYSGDDITRLRRVSALLQAGLNLAGVAMVLKLEEENTRLRSRLRRGKDADPR